LHGIDGLLLTAVAVSNILFSVAAITPLAYASWRFVELPAMNRRWSVRVAAVDRPVLAPGKV